MNIGSISYLKGEKKKETSFEQTAQGIAKGLQKAPAGVSKGSLASEVKKATQKPTTAEQISTGQVSPLGSRIAKQNPQTLEFAMSQWGGEDKTRVPQSREWDRIKYKLQAYATKMGSAGMQVYQNGGSILDAYRADFQANQAKKNQAPAGSILSPDFLANDPASISPAQFFGQTAAETNKNMASLIERGLLGGQSQTPAGKMRTGIIEGATSLVNPIDALAMGTGIGESVQSGNYEPLLEGLKQPFTVWTNPNATPEQKGQALVMLGAILLGGRGALKAVRSKFGPKIDPMINDAVKTFEAHPETTELARQIKNEIAKGDTYATIKEKPQGPTEGMLGQERPELELPQAGQRTGKGGSEAQKAQEVAKPAKGIARVTSDPEVSKRWRKDVDETLKNAGVEPDADGYVTLYHGTSEKNANAIKKSGSFNPNAYFTTDEAIAKRYAAMAGGRPKVVKTRVHVDELTANGNGVFTSQSNRIPLREQQEVTVPVITKKPSIRNKEAVVNTEVNKPVIQESRTTEPVTTYKAYKGIPKNDADGNPITVIDATKRGKLAAGYFSDSKDVAQRFANTLTKPGYSHVVEADIRIEKPFNVYANGKPAKEFMSDALNPEHNNKAIVDALKDPRYDGVIIHGTSDEGTIYIPKKSEQIITKSPKPEPKPTEQPKAKEPWEIGKSEYKPLFSRERKDIPEVGQTMPSKPVTFEANGKTIKGTSYHVPNYYGPQIVLTKKRVRGSTKYSAWLDGEQIGNEYLHDNPYDTIKEAVTRIKAISKDRPINDVLHELHVKRAVKNSKPVTDAVLNEYKGTPWADAEIARRATKSTQTQATITRNGYTFKESRPGRYAWFEGDKQLSGSFDVEGKNINDVADYAWSIEGRLHKAEATQPSMPSIKDHPEYQRIDRVYGKLSKDQLDSKLSAMDADIASNQKAGAREFTGNGTRRTSAAVSNEAARSIAQEKLLVQAYRNEKFAPTPPAKEAITPVKQVEVNKSVSFETAARNMTDAGSISGPRGSEWNIRDGNIEVYHSVTGSQLGTIDLKTGSVTPTNPKWKPVLEDIAQSVSKKAEEYSINIELDRLKHYPGKNEKRIAELEGAIGRAETPVRTETVKPVETPKPSYADRLKEAKSRYEAKVSAKEATGVAELNAGPRITPEQFEYLKEIALITIDEVGHKFNDFSKWVKDNHPNFTDKNISAAWRVAGGKVETPDIPAPANKPLGMFAESIGVYEKQGFKKETVQSWADQAKASNIASQAAEMSRQVIEGKRKSFNKVEEIGIAQRLDELAQIFDETNGANDTPSLAKRAAAEDEVRLIMQANKMAGTETAQALASRQFGVNRKDDMRPVMVKYRMEENARVSGVELKPEEVTRATEAAARLQEAEKRIAELESQKADLESQMLGKEPSKTVKARGKERFDSALAEFKKMVDSGELAKTTLGATGGFTPAHAKALKLAGQMVYGLLEQGVGTVAEAVSSVYGNFKDHGFTEREIRDAFSNYGSEPRAVSEMSLRKREARLLSLVEDLETGVDVPTRQRATTALIKELEKAAAQLRHDSPSATAKRLNDRIAKLRKRMQDAQDGIIKVSQKRDDPLKQIVSQVLEAESKARLKAENARLDKMIETGEYSADWKKARKSVDQETLDLRQEVYNKRRYVEAMIANAGRKPRGFWGTADAVARASQLTSITNRLADVAGNTAMMFSRIIESNAQSLIDKALQKLPGAEGPDIPRITKENLRNATAGMGKRIMEELTQQMKEGSPEFIAKYGIQQNAPGPLKYIERATGLTDVVAEDVIFRSYLDAFNKAGVDRQIADGLALDIARDTVLMSENVLSSMLTRGTSSMKSPFDKEAFQFAFNLAGGRFGKVIGNIIDVNTDYMAGGGLGKAGWQGLRITADAFRGAEGKGLTRLKNAVNSSKWTFEERQNFSKRITRGGIGAGLTYAGYKLAEKKAIDMEKLEKDHPLIYKMLSGIPGTASAVIFGAKLYKDKEKKDPKGFVSTFVNEVASHPYMRPAKTLNELGSGRKDLATISGGMAAKLIPSDVRWLAEILDEEKEWNARKPGSFWEQVMMGIPKLRESVPLKQQNAFNMDSLSKLGQYNPPKVKTQ